MPTLTKKQKAIYDYIKMYRDKHGFAPTFEEIKKRFKLKALSGVYQHVDALIKKDFLIKNNNSARGIEIKKTFQDFIKIPLLGTIAAGQPIEAIEEKEVITVPKTSVPGTGDLYALRVSGESMIKENINDGDVVIVKSQSTANDGQNVVALIDNYEVTLKKIYKEKNRIRLQPANPEMEPIYVSPKNLMIQGVVIDIIKNTDSNTDEDFEVEEYKELPLNKIIYGDAVDIMKRMPECSVDLTVTSPPYDELRNYNGYIFDFEGIAKNLFRVTKSGGVVVWVVGDKIKNGNRSLTSFRQALFFQKIGFNVHDVMIYKKKNTPFMRTNAYTNCFEFMFVFSKGAKLKTFNPLKIQTKRQGQEMLPFNKGADGINKKILGELKPEKTMTNIWEYAVGLHGTTSDKIAFKHPAVFPEKLVEDHVISWTQEGDVVFDPMCGSGTTCKVALQNNRAYIGCDISREYVKLATQRLKMYK